MPHIIAYARASHAEYRVGIEKLVPFREHMGDERVEPIFLDFEMDVGGPHRAAVRGREHFSNSAVGRDLIAFGADRFEAEATIVVRAKGGAQPGLDDRPMLVQIGRASCRERVGKYWEFSVVAVLFKK